MNLCVNFKIVSSVTDTIYCMSSKISKFAEKRPPSECEKKKNEVYNLYITQNNLCPGNFILGQL